MTLFQTQDKGCLEIPILTCYEGFLKFEEKAEIESELLVAALEYRPNPIEVVKVEDAHAAHHLRPESPLSGVCAVGFGSHASTAIGSFGLESDNTATAAAFGTRRSSLESDNTNPILELAFGTRFGYGSVGGGKQHRRPGLRFGFAARVSVDDEYVRYGKFVRPVEHWRCLTTRASGYGVARGGKFEAAAGSGQGRGP
ncbi:hypothetical protein K438DRAFT_1751065 [Mycena galopus ATCC 62051]|nr:hypothetical protein K438DRAFT_1751065 [Mycena galopus ATCC 62051]